MSAYDPTQLPYDPTQLTPENKTIYNAFVRALNPDGSLQLGLADAALPYGARPIEVFTITQQGALALIASLAGQVAEAQRRERVGKEKA